jgi:hypothetical protein
MEISELEREGVALLKQYGLLVKMNKPLSAFLRKVAGAMNWQQFAAML